MLQKLHAFQLRAAMALGLLTSGTGLVVGLLSRHAPAAAFILVPLGLLIAAGAERAFRDANRDSGCR